MGNTYNRVYIWCCKYGENRYCEKCANKKLCTSKHTGLLNSCLWKLCLHPYLVVPLISARVTMISTRVSAHCQAILLPCRLRSLHQGYFPDLIDQHDQHSVSTGIHVKETRSQQSARAACNAVVSMTLCGAHAGWHVNKNKSRKTPAWQLDDVNPAYSLKQCTMLMIIKIMITIIKKKIVTMIIW